MASQELVSWVGRKIYKYSEFEHIMNSLKREGYECIDIGGSSQDLVDHVEVVKNDGIWFEYIRCRGPECTVYNYLCLQNGQKAYVRSSGYEIHGDSMGCYTRWDEIDEFRNIDGEIVKTKLSGGSNIECPNSRLEHTTRL